MVFASGIGFHGAALPCGPSGPVGNLLQCGPRHRDGLRALDGAVGDTSGLRAQRVAYRPCAHARLSSAPACRERPVVYRPGASLVHSMAGSCGCDLWHRCPVVHALGAESHVVR